MEHVHKRRSRGVRSVFRTVMVPLLLLLLVETALLAGSLAVSGVFEQLDQNARDILNKQVLNRQNYLATSMVDNWSDLDRLAETINRQTQALLEEGSISLETLSASSDACAPLLRAVTNDLISTMYAKQVSGMFLVFNTQDLDAALAAGQYPDRSGIYLRDLDPTSTPSQRNADLLLERAPISLVNAMDIATDAGWQTLHTFDPQAADLAAYDFFYRPFQAAYLAGGAGSAEDYGFWCPQPRLTAGSQVSALSYSIPLILEDGTVYGVLGVDFLAEYLQTMLPYGELSASGQGAYFLAVSDRDNPLTYFPVAVSGDSQRHLTAIERLPLQPQDTGYTTYCGQQAFFVDLVDLPLYSTNAPFAAQRWAIIGGVSTDLLYGFTRQMGALLALALLLMLVAGVVGSFLISRRIAAPIRRLSAEVDQAQRSKGGIPHLSDTGIQEIDRFSGAITTLSRDVVNTSTRLLRIMEMASMELGGFELRPEERTLFVTANFFPLFGVEDVDPEALTVENFINLMTHLDHSLPRIPAPGSDVLYKVALPKGDIRYVRVSVLAEDGRRVGLAENVTAATVERLRIEHERDYDLLTGLLNRRAFYRMAETLFQTPEKLGWAAVIMLDLDNLKTVNDRFGHDWGDQYIRQAGRCFDGAIHADALCARISGDEFTVLLWGYESEAEVRSALDRFARAIRESSFVLPNGDASPIRVSGGVAWYPDDSSSFHELLKYADFAMYQVKHTHKGDLGEFDLGMYSRESFLAQNRAEFMQLLEQELVAYHFQPIVDSATGDIAAYEALMRVSLPTLRNPDAVLKLGRELGRLQDIERLTWFCATDAYQSLLEQNLVSPTALLFINSIASHTLTETERADFSARHGALLPRIVTEITESENLDMEITRSKRGSDGATRLFALDDYGSGYNSEKNLLALEPQFIKVDISIIRDIHTDPNKQRIVSNIVGYAHERNMKIVAEGLESAGEVRMVLDLGVDLLQGYFLARPAAHPGEVSQTALAVIREHRKKS